MTTDPTNETAEQLRVELGPRSYDIVIARGPAAGLGRFVRERLDGGRTAGETPRVLLVSDAHLEALGMVEHARGPAQPRAAEFQGHPRHADRRQEGRPGDLGLLHAARHGAQHVE